MESVVLSLEHYHIIASDNLLGVMGTFASRLHFQYYFQEVAKWPVMNVKKDMALPFFISKFKLSCDE